MYLMYLNDRILVIAFINVIKIFQE